MARKNGLSTSDEVDETMKEDLDVVRGEKEKETKYVLSSGNDRGKERGNLVNTSQKSHWGSKIVKKKEVYRSIKLIQGGYF